MRPSTRSIVRDRQETSRSSSTRTLSDGSRASRLAQKAEALAESMGDRARLAQWRGREAQAAGGHLGRPRTTREGRRAGTGGGPKGGGPAAPAPPPPENRGPTTPANPS